MNNYDFYATFNETNAGLGISNLLFCFDLFLETEHIQRCGCKDRLLKDGEISYCSQKPNKELKNKTFLNSLCLKYASKEFKCSLFKILKILHKKWTSDDAKTGNKNIWNVKDFKTNLNSCYMRIMFMLGAILRTFQNKIMSIFFFNW